MIEPARQEHPDLRFDESSMLALNIADGTLGGVLARYSIIHTPPEDLPVIFADVPLTDVSPAANETPFV